MGRVPSPADSGPAAHVPPPADTRPALRLARDRVSLEAARAVLPLPVGLVATMGALHAGHLALIERARADCASVVVSIFVNPTQFGPDEDYARYPRQLNEDLRACDASGVDLVFAPEVDVIYPPGHATTVDAGPLGSVLEGAARPGHFRGVATVVTILLDLVRPDRAYFGQKDGQQAVVVERLVRDLALPVAVSVVPTVREPDGLALSSRNAYLTVPERAAAPALHRALRAAADDYAHGQRDGERLRTHMREVLEAAPMARPDYVSVADRATLGELDVVDRPALLSVAVRFPSARLIDCWPLG
ncbi:MAG TPA: pantoate--beta-alanine ligase [Candidatus Acidoferrales bacterium]|nr:pantoate--beta-alanine ligase [Candidatus Acidoferrales bacterium]